MPEMKPRLVLSFGTLAPPIRQQLRSQGLTANQSEVAQFQRDANAVSRLMIRRLAPDSVGREARRRIINRLAEIVRTRK